MATERPCSAAAGIKWVAGAGLPRCQEVDVSGDDGLEPHFIPCLCSTTASLCCYNAINK